jgi:uncharacterized repeat protein (TIGR01451 family)
VVGGANAGAKTDAADGDQAEFDAAGHHVTFRLGTGADGSSGGRLEVPAGAPANATAIRFRVRIAESGLPNGFRVVNSAGVGFTAATLGGSGFVNSPDVVTPVRIPDLKMAKSHTGDFKPGARVPFRLTVTNVGDAPTFGTTTVTDTLPAELTFATPPAGAGWDCGATAGRALSCRRADALAPGDAFPPIEFVARVAGNAPAGQLENTATVTTPGDGDPTNDSDTDTGELTRPLVDLAIHKFAVTPLAFPGRPVAFVLRVHNHGPDTATRVTVRDFLPRGLTAVALRPSRGHCFGTVCRLGRMPAGARAAIAVLAVAGRDTGGRRLRDVATVRGRQDEVTLKNNRDTASVRIIPLVDLEVTKTTPAPSLPAGSDVSFTVVVKNNGPSTATQVSLTDTLPAGLQLISATPLQGTCTGLTCALGTLKSGHATQIVVEASSDPALAGQTVTNTAAARARQPELDLGNNTAAADVTFTALPPSPAPDLSVTKTADTNTVDVGGELTYRITARNAGPGAASHVVVTDTPDPGLQIVSVTPSQGTCSAGVPIVCDLGPLAPGAQATVVVVARATTAGQLRNGATAVPSPGGGGDGDVAEASASNAAVRLTKRATPSTVRPGDEVTYELTVTARGATARGIRVCDSLPHGLSITSLGGAHLRGGRPCWTIARLPASHSRTLRLRVQVSPSTPPGRITNTATLTFGNHAPITARARVRILPPLACPAAASASPVARIAC